MTWADNLTEGLMHPSPGMVVLILAVVLGGKTGELALAICLLQTVS